VESGGQAVPVQQSDWYWEEYQALDGDGTEFLVFVRYDISLDAARKLIETYTKPIEVGGSQVVAAFPLLAWHHPDFEGAAMVVEAGGKLARAGAQEGSLIAELGNTPTKTARALGEALAAGGDGARLELLETDGATAEES